MFIAISTAFTVYPKKYAHGFCFAVLCCGYTLTDFSISIKLTSLALWQSNDCPSASKATLMNTDKYFMWIHYERLHNHNKAKHNTTVCIFLGIYCTMHSMRMQYMSSYGVLQPMRSVTRVCFKLQPNKINIQEPSKILAHSRAWAVQDFVERIFYLWNILCSWFYGVVLTCIVWKYDRKRGGGGE